MKNKINRIIQTITLSLIVFLTDIQIAFANTGTEKVDELASGFLQPWIEKIGGGIVLIGLFQLARSFITDNPDSKNAGITFVAGGLMVRFGVPFFMQLVGF